MKHGFRDGFRTGRFSPPAIAGMVIGGLALAVVLSFLLGWIVMLLWNALMPQIFALPKISYWQGIGLIILSHILFGGLACGRGGDRREGGDGNKGKPSDAQPEPDDSWCESCDTCDNTGNCRPFAHGWIRTAYGWKQESGEERKS